MGEKNLLCDFIDNGVLVVDRNMRVIYVNPTLLKWAGLHGGDVAGIPCHIVFRDNLLPCSLRCMHTEVFSAGKTFTVTYSCEMPEGKERVLEVNAAPVMDQNGEITQMVEVIRDVTERKKASIPLDDKGLLHTLLEAMDCGIAVIDKDMRVVSANGRCFNREQSRPGDPVGKHCYEVFHRYCRPCSEKGEKCPVKNTFCSGLPSEAIHTHRDQDGNEQYFSLRTYPVKDGEGRVTQVVQTVNDITEKAENEIREKVMIIEMKEELEMLREELKKEKRSREPLSQVSP